MDSTPLRQFLIAGELRRDFILPPPTEVSERPMASINIPGGSLLYAASGLAIWNQDAGLISRVGEDYPQDWLEQISRRGFDINGVQITQEPLELRRFIAYTGIETWQSDNPVSHFARQGLEFPKSLLGYLPPPTTIDSRSQPTPYTLTMNEIPKGYMDATAAHICPMDYLTHHLVPPKLHQGHITTLTLDPSIGYMNPAFWDEVHVLVQGITAFLVSEEKLRALYHGRSVNLWDMAEDIGHHGCEIIVIKRGSHGQYIYDSIGKKHWQVPAYPAHVMDPTGAGDAFCGGFLAGYRKIYDPLEAALYGNISASFSIEGSGPFYALDTLPGLPEARLESIRDLVSRV